MVINREKRPEEILNRGWRVAEVSTFANSLACSKYLGSLSARYDAREYRRFSICCITELHSVAAWTGPETALSDVNRLQIGDTEIQNLRGDS
jgi:hypothetical protein